MRHIILTDDFAQAVKISKLTDEQVEEIITHLLKEARGQRSKQEYEKLLKGIRHKINKYLNFGKF